ncbi:MAG: thiolase family protein [Acinetobacter populi]|jgi:acetyl-CoA C-acetyltransferase|uniref:thiolase family protein n=1 Tax=Acinetobacter populi TaxID=1582270 RepID=UPI002356D8AA|nr:thiolase family protein [Acinetobacter populi]MCH4247034.1 thiolase family protein [Acinetobacter populi]
MSLPEIVICSPVRTPIGKFGGTLKNLSASDLGAIAISETLRRTQISADSIDSVIVGQVVQAGSKMNPARQAAIHGGLSIKTPALTVNRVCGSGAQAIVNAALEIQAGYASIVIAGGMENMDQAPYLLPKARWGARMGDAQIIDSLLCDGLNDAFSGQHSGWHTEELNQIYNISREDQDRWAVRSQQNFSQAQALGKFNKEIVAVELLNQKQPIIFNQDETNRPDTTIETLRKLKPVFRPDGSITAGNAPGLNSAASAMIVAQSAQAEKLGLQPVVKLVAHSVSAVEPNLFGIAPVPAIQQLLTRANWKLSDVDRFEINEAFASVPLACLRQLGLPEDIVNVEGGTIAHGHAIGATGAILTTRLIHSMQRDGLKRGVVSLCIGGGQGIALALEIL